MTNQFQRVIGYSQHWAEFISTGGFPFTPCQIVNTENLATQIFSCASEQFTGCLDIEAPQRQHWSLYFCRGLICGGSGVHPLRSWLRQLCRYCPQLFKEGTINSSHQFAGDNYDALAELVMQGKIRTEQMTEVVEGYSLEIFFDLIQQLEQTSLSNLRLTYSQIPQEQMDSALVTIEVDKTWRQALKIWQSWQGSDLTDISPNLAPKVLQPQELQKQFSQMLYDNLSGLGGINQTFKALQQETSQFSSDNLLASMDGNQTLRDLAVNLNRNLLLLTQPIIPYIRQGLIELIEVEDVSFSVASPTNINQEHPLPENPATPIESNPTSPLIACIEDSSVDLLLMNHILTQVGYGFINIEDQEKALSILIEKKPDLIFLDLVMPIANGYEICSQIRRIPFFKSTPVIIVTGKDGIIDRTRAKIVGASDFVTKPINKEKILQALQTHLPQPKVNQFQNRSTIGDWYAKQPIQYSLM
ncbi:response regulator [Coleofasciculus sp. G2-EDA-02]|uniref:response regulator n=1 Tax=Coleofasciculus sp. G2-EDA-02 TaxID=3069529 RepID=UPI0032F274E2